MDEEPKKSPNFELAELIVETKMDSKIRDRDLQLLSRLYNFVLVYDWEKKINHESMLITTNDFSMLMCLYSFLWQILKKRVWFSNLCEGSNINKKTKVKEDNTCNKKKRSIFVSWKMQKDINYFFGWLCILLNKIKKMYK